MRNTLVNDSMEIEGEIEGDFNTSIEPETRDFSKKSKTSQNLQSLDDDELDE